MDTAKVQTVQQPCKEVACPSCKSIIRYSLLHLPHIPQPFMYCDTCSNVLYRQSDQEALYDVLPPTGNTESAALKFYEELERTAPPCPCGGHFRLWSNVKCPSCRFEIPYNKGVKDTSVRINDAIVVVIDGAFVLGDNPARSWKCSCTK